MGLGDELMASGHARVVHEQTGKRVMILDFYRRPRWSEMWEGLPWIARPKERGDFALIQNGPQCRPYIEYPFSIPLGQRWTDWRARDHLGAIAFTHEEKQFARSVTAGLAPFVVIEPNLATKANPNKQWGARNWQDLADRMVTAGLSPVQFIWGGPVTLRRVKTIKTPNFRMGAAVLSHASAAILPEGGLHHAAAVLGIPAVVLFGGAVSPETTGYPSHINLADEGVGSPCGSWKPCKHCRRVWSRLQPQTVMQAFHTLTQAKAA